MNRAVRRDITNLIIQLDAEWDKEDARIRGEQNQDSPWISTDRDVWHVNPYWGKYDDNGQPLMKDDTRCRHPED